MTAVVAALDRLVLWDEEDATEGVGVARGSPRGTEPSLLEWERDAAAFAFLRLPQVVRFDVALHPWREAVLGALEVDGGADGGAALAGLPPAPEGSGKRGGSRGTGTPWIRRWKSRKPEAAARLIDVYVGFLRGVVQERLVAVCERFGSRAMADGLLFQREPSFRCHTPSPRPTGRPHTDAEYGHQISELNVWLPMCRAFGSNSLWAETAPGRGDFAPFRLDYGEAMFFWGNRCRHYTVPNDSGVARVSIDCRVCPRRAHDPDAPRIDGRAPAFHVGGYYAALLPSGDVDPDVNKPKGFGVLFSLPTQVGY